MIFINTRPTNRAKPLTHELQAKGLTVIELPLLELVRIDLSHQEKNYQQAFVNDTQAKKTYQALVVISPTAAKLGLANCPPHFRPHCPVIAVGQTTAKVMTQAGWQVSCPVESSNEGMIQMAVFNNLSAHDSVLIWRGRGGRRLLVEHLQQKKVTVNAIEWYERRCPDGLRHRFNIIKPRLKPIGTANDNLQVDSHSINHDVSSQSVDRPIVLISSGEAFNNWQSLISQSADRLLTDFKYLTFGHRLTEALQKMNLTCARLQNLDSHEVLYGIDKLQRQPNS